MNDSKPLNSTLHPRDPNAPPSPPIWDLIWDLTNEIEIDPLELQNGVYQLFHEKIATVIETCPDKEWVEKILGKPLRPFPEGALETVKS